MCSALRESLFNTTIRSRKKDRLKRLSLLRCRALSKRVYCFFEIFFCKGNGRFENRVLNSMRWTTADNPKPTAKRAARVYRCLSERRYPSRPSEKSKKGEYDKTGYALLRPCAESIERFRISSSGRLCLGPILRNPRNSAAIPAVPLNRIKAKTT